MTWGWLTALFGLAAMPALSAWAAGFAYWITRFVGWIVGSDMSSAAELIQAAVEQLGWLASLTLVVAGVRMVVLGQQHTAPVLPRLRELPAHEPVVLFLRAFSDDTKFARVGALRWWWVLLGLAPWPGQLRTEEDLVARAMAPFGRMVALGSPSDRLPNLGAQRSYASDEDWRAEALAALDRAALVLMVPGAGGGLAWEVDEVVRRNDPTRLVLLVGRDRKQYDRFREELGGRFPKSLPELHAPRWWKILPRGLHVRAVVSFDADWTPRLEMLDGNLSLPGFVLRTQKALPAALPHLYAQAPAPAPASVRAKPDVPRPKVIRGVIAVIVSYWMGIQAWWVWTVSMLPSSGWTAVAALLDAWPLWICWVVLGVWMYRVWRGGVIAVTLARAHGFTVIFLLLPCTVVSAVVWAMISLLGNVIGDDLSWGEVIGFLCLALFSLVPILLGTVGMFWTTKELVSPEVRGWLGY